MIDREALEQQLSQLPIFQYLFLPASELVFTDRVRQVCQSQCPMYNTNWACPPAVGTVEECKARCLAYTDVLALTTATEVEDIENLEQTLATRAEHEELTRQAVLLLKQQTDDIFVLSTEACAHCRHCAWPDAPCRFPEKMYPCVESHGILATDIAEKCGIDFFNGNLVIWFSLLFFRDR